MISIEPASGLHGDAAGLTLYGHPFSRAHRCLWMLKELAVPFTHVPTGFQDGATRLPEYLQLNPNGRVPTLVHDGLVLFESLAINLHLAAAFGGPLAPCNAREQALATQWSFWVTTEVEKPLLLAAANSVLFPEPDRSHSERALALAKLARPLKVLDALLATRPYLIADHFTVADLNVAAVMSLAAVARIDLDGYAKVQRWLNDLLERPAAADWKPIHFTIPRPSAELGVLAMFV